MQVEIIKRSRLNGRDVEAGEVVELNAALAVDWFRAGRARKMSLPAKPPKVEIQLKALDVYSPEELGKLTVKNLHQLARLNGIEVSKKADKQDLIDLLIERQEDEGSEKEAGGEGDQGTTKPTEEGLLDMSMKKLLQLARLNGIKVSKKATKIGVIHLLIEAKRNEGTGEECDEEKKDPGEAEGENPASSY